MNVFIDASTLSISVIWDYAHANLILKFIFIKAEYNNLMSGTSSSPVPKGYMSFLLLPS